MRFLPRAGDEIPEQGDRPRPRGFHLGLRVRLAGMAFPANLFQAVHPDRAERDALRAPAPAPDCPARRWSETARRPSDAGAAARGQGVYLHDHDGAREIVSSSLGQGGTLYEVEKLNGTSPRLLTNAGPAAPGAVLSAHQIRFDKAGGEQLLRNPPRTVLGPVLASPSSSRSFLTSFRRRYTISLFADS